MFKKILPELLRSGHQNFLVNFSFNDFYKLVLVVPSFWSTSSELFPITEHWLHAGLLEYLIYKLPDQFKEKALFTFADNISDICLKFSILYHFTLIVLFTLIMTNRSTIIIYLPVIISFFNNVVINIKLEIRI